MKPPSSPGFHELEPDGTPDRRSDTGITAVFDAEHLRLMCGGDSEFEATVIHEYRQAVEGLLAQLAAALAESDQNALRALAHTLKGNSATLGAVTLARHGHTLETLTIETPDWIKIARLFEDIRIAHATLDRVLLEHLRGRG